MSESDLSRASQRDLMLSLESEDVNADVEQAWAAEAQRRSEAYARGETESRVWRESLQRVRKLLAKRRKP